MWCNGSAAFGSTRSTSGRGHDAVLRAGSRWPIGEARSRLQQRESCCRMCGNRKVVGRLIDRSVSHSNLLRAHSCRWWRCCICPAPGGSGVLGPLWALWWLVVAVGRQRGAPSVYDRSQQVVVAWASRSCSVSSSCRRGNTHTCLAQFLVTGHQPGQGWLSSPWGLSYSPPRLGHYADSALPGSAYSQTID